MTGALEMQTILLANHFLTLAARNSCLWHQTRMHGTAVCCQPAHANYINIVIADIWIYDQTMLTCPTVIFIIHRHLINQSVNK